MPTSKHQRTLASLRHRKREAFQTAATAAIEIIRDRTQSRERLEEAIRAVAQYDEACDALNLAEAEMPKPLKSGE